MLFGKKMALFVTGSCRGAIAGSIALGASIGFHMLPEFMPFFRHAPE